jgi:flagellar hook-basal body complex protein FliE
MKTSGLDNLFRALPNTSPDKSGRAGQNTPAFSDMLKQSISDVDRLEVEAEQAVQDFALGKTSGVHETMIALEKADISFQLLMQVRNKLISAYETIMRTQV